MAINYSYPKDLVLENSDLFLGIRASDNRTVNYTAQAVSDFLNTNGEISISSQLSFRFTVVENQPKTISFPGGGGNNTLFSNITELVVSIIDVSSSNVTVFLNYLIDSDILLSQQNEPNLFGHYKITGYTQNGISPFYTLSLEFIGGSGNITDETYYDIAPLNLSQGNPLQNLQQVTDIGNVTTNEIEVSNIGGDLYNTISSTQMLIVDDTNGFHHSFNLSGISRLAPGGVTVIQYDDPTGTGVIKIPNVVDSTETFALLSDIPVYTTPSLKEVLAVEGRMPFPVTAEYFFESTNKSETIIVDTTDPIDFYLNDDTFAIGDEIEIYNKLSTNSRIGVIGIETTQIYYKDEIIDADMLNMVTLPLYSKSWLKCVAENVFELVIIEQNEPQLQDLQSVLNEGNIATDSTIELYNTINDLSNFINSQEIAIENSSTNDYSYLNINALSLRNEALASTISVQHDKVIKIKGDFSTSLTFTDPTANRVVTFKDESGTVAYTSDIPSLAGYVPYTGATADVNLGVYGLTSEYLQLNTTPTTYTPAVGRLGWNDTDGTLEFKLKGNNVTLQIGQEQVIRVVNKTTPLINLLEANYQVAGTLGVVTETINANQEGFITTSGQVKEINTTGSLQGETWTDGDILYLSPTTAGAITNIKPIAPNHTVIVGYVEYAHAIHGKIFVKIDNGYELNELHNVKITGTPANNNLLAYTSSLSVWENKTAQDAGVLTIAVPTTTGVVITFVTDRLYGSIASPETGNITADVTNAQIGVTNIIVHNSGTAPTFGAEFKKLSGSGNYVTSVVNYIYCTYINATEIIYSINQRT